MVINIRREEEKDYAESEFVVNSAFEKDEYSDHREKQLVSKLRLSDAFVPELSLVAEVEDRIVGHIMHTKLIIKNEDKEEVSLALAPVSVIPEYQRKGIGSKLINESFKIAKELGFKSMIVLGHADFYPKFGFVPASKWNIKAPFDISDEYFMAVELVPGGLNNVSGCVKYTKEFFE